MYKQKHITTIASITAGMAIMAFALFNIHSRCAISEGGVLGATLLIQYWFHISPSISSFVIDVSFFLLGLYVLGRRFLMKSLLASVLFSLWYAIFEYFGPVLPDLSTHLLTAAILGGILVGIGAGLAVRCSAAPGGDDVLVLVLNKLFQFKVSLVYFFSDAVILLLSLSYIPFHDIFYSLISVMVSSRVIEILVKQ